MPNSTRADNGSTLHDLRQKPGRLVSNQDLAEIGMFKSYDAITRAVQSGKLPKPYKIGLRSMWEERAILRFVGASAAIPAGEDEQAEAA